MVRIPIAPDILYPDSHDNLIAENTIQYRWIVRLVTNLKRLLNNQAAFVAGDLLWYPLQVESPPIPAQAPDVMVVLGRPEGERSSYKQWEEDNIAPQVIFEIISPRDSAKAMLAKQSFYKAHGVLELFFYDPEVHDFLGFVRPDSSQDFSPLTPTNFPWVSPSLGIRFDWFESSLAIFYPGGEAFKDPETFIEERDRAFAKLREFGVDPEQL